MNLREAFRAGLDEGRELTRHLTMDPACAYHKAPRTRRARRRFDRNRGRTCSTCYVRRTLASLEGGRP